MIIQWAPLVAVPSTDFPTASQIAAAVWGETMLDYTDASTFGGFVKKLLTVVKFLGLK